MRELSEFYREPSFFDSTTTYVFYDRVIGYFTSKVHFDKGCWWTNEQMQFKATSIPCIRILRKQ